MPGWVRGGYVVSPHGVRIGYTNATARRHGGDSLSTKWLHGQRQLVVLKDGSVDGAGFRERFDAKLALKDRHAPLVLLNRGGPVA
jgi:hypothetical protein